VIGFLAASAVKASLLLAMGLLFLLAARKAPSAFRHQILTASLLGAVAIAPLSIIAPAIYLDVLGRAPAEVTLFAAGHAGGVERPLLIGGPAHEPLPEVGSAGFSAGAALLLAWLVPAALLMLGTLFSRLRFALVAARALPFRDRATIQRAGQIAAALGLTRKIRILEAQPGSIPYVFGVWSPVVMLPPEASAWARQRLKIVLVHEFMHIKRMDAAAFLLAEIACAFLWFNPLVWIAARQLKLESERACDEQVLATNVAPQAYAHCLVASARDSLGGPLAAPAGAMPIIASEELESRVRRILRDRGHQPGRWRKPRPYAALAVLPLSLSLGGLQAEAAPAAVGTGLTAASSARSASIELAQKPTFDNWVDDPRSELLGSVTTKAPVKLADFADPRDRAAVAKLLPHAARTSTAYDDLVGERARWALAQAEAGTLIEPLIGKLASSDWRERSYSAWALSFSADARPVEPLTQLLDDPVWRVRMGAAYALLHLGERLDEDRASHLAQDSAWQVRMAAIEHLAEVREPWAARLLSTLAEDGHRGTRTVAADALAKL
jgi:beta-lactamase regulating signal transducer with metallopeptidase domain